MKFLKQRKEESIFRQKEKKQKCKLECIGKKIHVEEALTCVEPSSNQVPLVENQLQREKSNVQMGKKKRLLKRSWGLPRDKGRNENPRAKNALGHTFPYLRKAIVKEGIHAPSLLCSFLVLSWKTIVRCGKDKGLQPSRGCAIAHGVVDTIADANHCKQDSVPKWCLVGYSKKVKMNMHRLVHVFQAPRCYPMPLFSPPNYKEVELGMKISCGFEMMYHQYELDVEDGKPEINMREWDFLKAQQNIRLMDDLLDHYKNSTLFFRFNTVSVYWVVLHRFSRMLDGHMVHRRPVAWRVFWQLGHWCLLQTSSSKISDVMATAKESVTLDGDTKTPIENDILLTLDSCTPIVSVPKKEDVLDWALLVVNTKTKVDVLWQDGTRSLGVDSKTLFPIDNLGDHDFCLEHYVLKKALDEDRGNSEAKRVGIVKSVDSKEHIAKTYGTSRISSRI
eukprot:Gb_03391 [translate_table: standard]